ncbi:hypothetical protein [Algoriphagus formosus]
MDLQIQVKFRLNPYKIFTGSPDTLYYRDRQCNSTFIVPATHATET